VRLKNIGAREGTQTLFLFLHHASTERARPYLQLRDFTKCTLKKDEEQVISFTLDEHHFAQYDDHDDVIFESGLYDIYVGTKADFNHLLSCQITIDRQLNILSFTPNT
jgi:beta-glucosidase